MRSINREFVHVISIKLILLSCSIGSLNVLFLKSFELSLILVAFESLALVYFLIKNDITNYIGCYLIFFTLSFEFDYVIGNDYSGFYGFKSFSLFGLNLGIIALLPILAKLLLNKLRISYVKQHHLYLYQIFISLLILFSTGIFIGLINIITNDNNVLSFSNSLSLFLGEVYQNALFPLLLIVCYIYLVTFEGPSITRLIPYIYAILFGTIAAMIISLSTNNFGFYGGILTLLAQPVSAFVPFLALLFFTHQSPIRKLLLVSFYITGLFLSLKYNASGKMLIFLVALPLLFLFCSNMMAKHKVSLSIAFLSFLVFFVYLLPMFLYDYQLLNI